MPDSGNAVSVVPAVTAVLTVPVREERKHRSKKVWKNCWEKPFGK